MLSLRWQEDERLLAFAATPAGRIAVWGAASVLLAPFAVAPIAVPALALIQLAPARRRLILSLAAVAVAVVAVAGEARGPASPASLALATLVLLLLPALVFLAARRFRALPRVVRESPQTALHLLMWAALPLAWWLPAGSLRPALLLVVVLLPFLVWRCGYLLLAGKRGTARDTAYSDHLFYLWPAWGGSNVPFGKGFDLLAEKEADGPAAFARAQLAGLKLLGLAWIWKLLYELMRAVVYADPGSRFAPYLGGVSLALPSTTEMLRGAELPVAVAWLAVYVELIRATLWLAGWGHVVIGALRLFGFHVARNTDRPLLAETLLDFWNRYYFYFKELLVEFFFYPVYLRYFRERLWQRIAAAIFAAAFFGNLYYHVLTHWPGMVAGDFSGVLQFLPSHAFYCLLLASGISVSMYRQRQRRGAVAAAPSGWRRLRRIAAVWTFFGLIHIWGAQVDADFFGRTRFFLSLFGLSRLMGVSS